MTFFYMGCVTTMNVKFPACIRYMVWLIRCMYSCGVQFPFCEFGKYFV